MTFKSHSKFSEFYSELSDTEGYQREIIKPFLIQARKTLGFLCIWENANSCSAPVKLSFWAGFQKLCPQPGAVQGILMTWGEDPVIGCSEHHPTGLSPSIQPVHISSQSRPTVSQNDTPTQLGVIKFTTEGTLNGFGHISRRDNKQKWAQRTPLVTGHHQDVAPFTTTIWALSQQFLTQQRVQLSSPGLMVFSRLCYLKHSQRLYLSTRRLHPQILPQPRGGSSTPQRTSHCSGTTCLS